MSIERERMYRMKPTPELSWRYCCLNGACPCINGLKNSSKRTVVVFSIVGLFFAGCLLGSLSAQDPAAATPPDTSGEAAKLNELVSEHVPRLSDSSYRVRQIARSIIEQHPNAALEVIPAEIRRVDAVVGVQLVDIISGLAMHSDLMISSKAIELLNSLANDATSVGRGASNSLSAIADLQEEKAIEILMHHGAYIGPQNFSLNGREANSFRLSLAINDDFSGSDDDLEWIQFLKSIEVIYLRGKKISATAVEAAAKLKQLKAIRFHGINLAPQQLLLFKDLVALDHLGLSYMPVDDSYVPIIQQLPITESIRLYGTKITDQGHKQLVSSFGGLEIFRGSGGFLGISSVLNSTIVEKVTPGSAADEAGIRSRDEIFAINDVEVKTFDRLRAELGKFEAGDTVEIVVRRFVFLDGEVQQVQEIVSATLKEES